MQSSLFSALCERVIDGDSVMLRLTDKKRLLPAQLAAVSAPEKGEPYCAEATIYLATLIEGKELRVKEQGTDRFGRAVCRLFCGDTDVNLTMVQSGFARSHAHYADETFATAEREAIAAKRGMWTTLTPKDGSPAAEKEGTCLKVLDGDTIIFREAGAVDSIKIRLWGIDAPEKDQSFGPHATRKLTRLIEHKAVTLRFHEKARESDEGRDGYSRDLATIYRKGRNINLELVQGGYAWHYAYYAADNTELAAAQRQARAARIGLWAEENPTEPRLFRRSTKRKEDS